MSVPEVEYAEGLLSNTLAVKVYVIMVGQATQTFAKSINL